ncbi:MAG: hypothetical protein LC791_01190 [Acidobacteria bacterium]|nr:hypothetical protein [Acidobacteriota bacterium]
MTGALRRRDLALWSESHLVLAALLTVFTYVFVASSWVSDDAYISFRVVDNVVHGYGLTYNTVERVQAYTHPLWLLLHIPAYVLIGNVFYATLALSYVALVATFIVSARALGTRRLALLMLMVLGSKAFVDYTSSGLENPLTYLLFALFYSRFLAESSERATLSFRDIVWYVLIASLVFVNRIDSVLILFPALVWIVVSGARSLGWRVLQACAIGGLPVVLWELFALVYYGFALPNTYYAKVATGIPESWLFTQGLAYALNSLAYDPLTLGVIALAVILAIVSRRMPLGMLAVGLVLSLTYTVWVGGDHMGGRFFSAPFFVAAFLLAWSIHGQMATRIIVVSLAAYHIAAPLAPIKAGPGYQQAWSWRDTNGIQDERGYYHRATNLLLYNPLRERPDHEWFRQGLSFARGGERVTVQGSIGFFGYQAGPDRFVVDQNALSDALLARLPVSDRVYFNFYVGHYERDIPEGYVESFADGQNRLVDPVLHDFYDRLLNVTRGPIWSWSRMVDIWQLNVGGAGRLHSVFNRRRSMHVSIPATNDRLRTDTGVRDYSRVELRTDAQRAGYLQYGPNVPMRPGRYHARWVGSYESTPPMNEVGFVEVWIDGHQMRDAVIQAAGYAGTERKLAAIDFEITRAADDVELRLYLHAGAKVVLQTLEIEGGPVER